MWFCLAKVKLKQGEVCFESRVCGEVLPHAIDWFVCLADVDVEISPPFDSLSLDVLLLA